MRKTNAFKKAAEADIMSVFINEDEFAGEHDLNGTICKAVLQGELTGERKFFRGAVYDDVYEAAVVVHVKKDCLPEVPVRDEIFSLDGNSFIVANCTDDMGVLTIELTANRG